MIKKLSHQYCSNDFTYIQLTKKFKRDHICYADLDTSVDEEHHKAYCICFSLDGVDKYYYGHNCAMIFLKAISTNTLIYFHNLSYDITFIINHLTSIMNNPIIKNGRTYSLIAIIKEFEVAKIFLFKNSYAIKLHPQKRFPIMFGLDSEKKEVFPYNYYSSNRTNQMYGNIDEALEDIKEEDRESFIQNVNELKVLNLMNLI